MNLAFPAISHPVVGNLQVGRINLPDRIIPSPGSLASLVHMGVPTIFINHESASPWSQPGFETEFNVFSTGGIDPIFSDASQGLSKKRFTYKKTRPM